MARSHTLQGRARPSERLQRRIASAGELPSRPPSRDAPDEPFSVRLNRCRHRALDCFASVAIRINRTEARFNYFHENDLLVSSSPLVWRFRSQHVGVAANYDANFGIGTLELLIIQTDCGVLPLCRRHTGQVSV